MSPTIAEQISEFATELSFDDLPESVITKVKMHIADSLASGLAGAGMPHSRAVQNYVGHVARAGKSTVLGTDQQLTAELAALANATAIHGIESDDYHTGALAHPGCVAVPVALALGEQDAQSGKQFISGVAVGMEITLRFGRAMMPSLIADRGFHETGVTGVFGAAAAAANIRHLSTSLGAQAIGLAASHAAGTTEFTHGGGEVKRLHAGIAAGAGVRSATLSEFGLTAPLTAIEGPRGLLQAYCKSWNETSLTDRLGTWWDLLDTSIKPIASCGALIAPVALLERMLVEEGITSDQIAEIEVGLDATSLRHVGAAGAEPTDLVSAQMSARYSLGMTAAGRGNSLSDYLRAQEQGFRDAEVVSIAKKVRLLGYPEADQARPEKMLAFVSLLTTDGRRTQLAGEAPGTPSLPLTDAQFSAKFESLVAPTLGVHRARTLLECISSVENHTIGDLSALLRTTG